MSGNPSPAPKAQAKSGGPSAVIRKGPTKAKVGPAKQADLDFNKDPSISEAFVVVVASPQGSRSITYHRAIGQTKVAADSWVATPTADVQDLLNRRVNPGIKEVDAKRLDKTLEIALTRKLLDKKSGEIHYPVTIKDPASGEVFDTPRSKVVALARKRASEAAGKGKKPSPLAYIALLPKEYGQCEQKYIDFVKDLSVKAEVEKDLPYPAFETKSGPLADREQKEVTFLSGKTLVDAQDAVMQHLFGVSK